MSAIERVLVEVAEEVAWMVPPPVFIGGATIGLFLDNFGRSQLRPTKDVDCIVPTLVSRPSWFALEETLRSRGWHPDVDGPVCRYRSPRGHLVDFLAVHPEIQGFAGRWFAAALASASAHVVAGKELWVPDAAHLLACKLEAYEDRGAADPLLSKDLEDIVALVDGCGTLVDAVARAPVSVRAYVRESVAALLTNEDAMEAVAGHLPRGGDVSARLRKVQARLLGLVRG